MPTARPHAPTATEPALNPRPRRMSRRWSSTVAARLRLRRVIKPVRLRTADVPRRVLSAGRLAVAALPVMGEVPTRAEGDVAERPSCPSSAAGRLVLPRLKRGCSRPASPRTRRGRRVHCCRGWRSSVIPKGHPCDNMLRSARTGRRFRIQRCASMTGDVGVRGNI